MSYKPIYCRETILQLARQGLTDLQVAIVTGASKSLVVAYRNKAKIRVVSRNQPWKKDEDAELIRLLQDGDRRQDIAKWLRRTESQVLHRIERLGLNGKYNHYHFKLHDHEFIWQLNEIGCDVRNIARWMGMSKSNVWRVLRLKPSVFG